LFFGYIHDKVPRNSNINGDLNPNTSSGQDENNNVTNIDGNVPSQHQHGSKDESPDYVEQKINSTNKKIQLSFYSLVSIFNEVAHLAVHHGCEMVTI